MSVRRKRFYTSSRSPFHRSAPIMKIDPYSLRQKIAGPPHLPLFFSRLLYFQSILPPPPSDHSMCQSSSTRTYFNLQSRNFVICPECSPLTASPELTPPTSPRSDVGAHF